MTNSFAIIGSRGYPSTYGGFETFVRRFAPYLAHLGDDVTVYCRGGPVGVRTTEGVRCVTTRGVDRRSVSTLSYGLTSARHGRSEDYDAALVLNVANGFFLPTLRRAGIPTAVNVDGLEWRRAKWGTIGKAVFRRGAALTARHANEIVADSKEIARVWRDDLGRESTFIPYGADVTTDVADSRVRELGLRSGGYILAVARLAPENNVDLVLDALDRVDGDIPTVVVGTMCPETPLVRRLRDRANREPNFQWLGHVDDQELLTQLWAHCGVYFHGHSAGGTNPALLQALGHGAPTIALETPFNAEVIDNPRQLVAPDADVLAGRIQELFESPDLGRKYACLGQSRIREHYSWDTALSAYRNLLLQLCTSSGAVRVTKQTAC